MSASQKIGVGKTLSLVLKANTTGDTVAPTASVAQNNVSVSAPVLTRAAQQPDTWTFTVTGMAAGTDTVTTTWTLGGVAVVKTQAYTVQTTTTGPTDYTIVNRN